MTGGEKEVLYVGGDDSNHAGDSKGEIIAATFSTIQKTKLNCHIYVADNCIAIVFCFLSQKLQTNCQL